MSTLIRDLSQDYQQYCKCSCGQVHNNMAANIGSNGYKSSNAYNNNNNRNTKALLGSLMYCNCRQGQQCICSEPPTKLENPKRQHMSPRRQASPTRMGRHRGADYKRNGLEDGHAEMDFEDHRYTNDARNRNQQQNANSVHRPVQVPKICIAGNCTPCLGKTRSRNFIDEEVMVSPMKEDKEVLATTKQTESWCGPRGAGRGKTARSIGVHDESELSDQTDKSEQSTPVRRTRSRTNIKSRGGSRSICASLKGGKKSKDHGKSRDDATSKRSKAKEHSRVRERSVSEDGSRSGEDSRSGEGSRSTEDSRSVKCIMSAEGSRSRIKGDSRSREQLPLKSRGNSRRGGKLGPESEYCNSDCVVSKDGKHCSCMGKRSKCSLKRGLSKICFRRDTKVYKEQNVQTCTCGNACVCVNSQGDKKKKSKDDKKKEKKTKKEKKGQKQDKKEKKDKKNRRKSRRKHFLCF